MSDSLNLRQPMCDGCWRAINPGHIPGRADEPTYEMCAWCYQPTHSGIYVRAHPNTVPYPKR
jgi:hypothetical protein